MSNFRRYKIYYLASIIAVLLAIVGFTYAFFEGEIVNNAEFKQNIVFESETYRLTTEGNAVLSANASGLDMFHKGEDKVVSETSTTINLTLENYDEEYRVCTYDVVWNWNENSDEYAISSGATKEYTISGNTELIYTTSSGTESGNYDGIIEETQIPNYNTNNNVLYSGTVEGNGTIKKWLNLETKFYNLTDIDQSSHISKNYSGYVTVENIKCNKTQYPKLSTDYGKTVLTLVSNQGVDTSSVTEVYFVDLATSWPGSEADVAYFTAQDDGLIKAWTVGNKLYVGQSGKVMPGPSMISAFEGKSSNELIKIDLSAIDTSEVTSMARMFDYAGETASSFELNLGDNFDTSNVTDMFVMFQFCGKTDTDFTIDLGDKFDTSKVQDMAAMFNNTGRESSIFELDLGDKFDTSNVTDMSYMFQGSGYNSTNYTLDLGDKFDTSKVTDMYIMFAAAGYNASSLTLNLGNKFDTSKVTNMNSTFQNTGRNATSFALNLGDKFDTSQVTNMFRMFYYCGLQSKNFTLNLGSKFDTSKVTDMTAMFRDMGTRSTVLTLDLGDKFDTSNVTSMANMFYDTGQFSTVFELKLGDKFDTSNVQGSMDAMFFSTGMSSPIFTLDLGDKFDTSKITSMQSMFHNMGNANPNFTLNLGDKFDTSKVTNMRRLFCGTGMSSTTFQIDFGSKFDTSSAIDMSEMFQNTGISNPNFTLDLSDWIIQSSCNLTSFLQHTCPTIIFGEGWSSATLVPEMFLWSWSTPRATTIVNAPANIQAYDWAGDNRAVTFTTA